MNLGVMSDENKPQQPDPALPPEYHQPTAEQPAIPSDIASGAPAGPPPYAGAGQPYGACRPPARTPYGAYAPVPTRPGPTRSRRTPARRRRGSATGSSGCAPSPAWRWPR